MSTVPNLTWRERLALRLAPDYSRLRDLCIDLNAQVTDLKNQGFHDGDEMDAYARMRVEHTEMFNRERELGIWIRDTFKEDIAQGKHAGKTLIEVLQMHLGERNGK